MKLLIIGSGGREHALARKLSQSSHVSQVYVAPGNVGTSLVAENVPINELDLEALKTFALEQAIDLTIVGPEAPLVAGIVDLFRHHHLKIVGPDAVGAQLEGSKQWAKDLMKKYGIPTADFETFTAYEPAKAYLHTKNAYPIVIKADGLAAGKGVTVAQSYEEAEAALKACFVDQLFENAGSKVVIESFLKGAEASLFAFTDGKTILPMIPAQDHKAIFDGDKGPNTGGMGAYAPAPLVTPEIYETVQKRVFEPLLKGFQQEGIDYRGIVYAGLMIDTDGSVSIVEFNARFGDPETQVVLPLLKTDLALVFKAVAEQTLDQIQLEWASDSAVCVVMASAGYPGSYEKGKIITGISDAETVESVHVIQAGVKAVGDDWVTSGGRVLAVVAQNKQLDQAIRSAYEGVQKIAFDGAYYRSDIGAKAALNNVR